MMKMYKARMMILIALCLIAFLSSAMAQAESVTYDETRNLLLQLERSNYENGALPTLFHRADSIRTDLEKALYDKDPKVSLNAQVVIKYVAEKSLLGVFDKWVESRKISPGTYWVAPIKLLFEETYLEGKGDNLTKLVLKTFHPNDKTYRAKVIATNKMYNTALIEVVSGQVFTEGWHVVVRKENNRWRILSHSLVWQS